tara:strand:- start:5632 stop:5928 length:297 start_codon:yes stop_codon:yes gene_type:complete
MIMSIKLEYILKRNKSNLKTFIQKNRLTSYQRLLEYCESRKFIPCAEEEYNKVVKEPVQNERKKVSGKASQAQEPKKRRYRRKKQQDTPKLPDSSDDG